MTCCPDPAYLEGCTDQTPCAGCPTVVDGVSWAYDRTQGWHEPDGAHACPAVLASIESEVVQRLTSEQRNALADLAEDQGAAPPTEEVV